MIRRVVPKLKQVGAGGIVEYPLSKIIEEKGDIKPTSPRFSVLEHGRNRVARAAA